MMFHPKTNAQNLTNANCRPIEDLSDQSVFLGQMGLDERPFLHGEDLGLSRSVDFVEDGHGPWLEHLLYTNIYTNIFARQGGIWRETLSHEKLPDLLPHNGFVSL